MNVYPVMQGKGSRIVFPSISEINGKRSICGAYRTIASLRVNSMVMRARSLMVLDQLFSRLVERLGGTKFVLLSHSIASAVQHIQHHLAKKGKS